ncbi:hypothetical protein PybrP1_007460 [[Pythium] brassicae (nom. inval.)]|nr:hypothetical protein PybrP1_007460 [[Pythium] brassicae (nom. inval.)]
MGQRWSLADFTRNPPAPALRPPRVDVSVPDALAICENGDLLLLREQVATPARIAMAPTVARDISRMQRGAFPTQRLTNLPGAL